MMIFVVLIYAWQSFSQIPDPLLSGNDYLKRSRNQKTAAWIVLAGGTTMAVIGGVSISQMNFWSSDNDRYDTAGYLFLGGVVCDLVSIPFFIGSAVNKRRAATLSINDQKLLFPLLHTNSSKPVILFTLKIRL